MKVKKGYKWKSIEGPAKGKEFTVIEITSDNVVYRSEDSCRIYTTNRKEFEKYIQRVVQYWHDKNKNYKVKRQQLKEKGE